MSDRSDEAVSNDGPQATPAAPTEGPQASPSEPTHGSQASPIVPAPEAPRDETHPAEGETAPPSAPATAPPTGDTAAMPLAPTAEDHPAATDPTAVLERPASAPFLQATALTAHGRQGPIFTDITLTAHLGQIVALTGDGGEGRSSLLLALTGRFPHRSGTLEVDGQTKPGQIRRRFTIAQAGPPIRFDDYATVATCIKETTTITKGAATRANINAWLDRLAVDIDTGDTYGFLPRIDQIRFTIACAAASRTPAIAVDDTDTGLDNCGAERVFEALRTVADAGQLVIAACTRPDPPADTLIDLRAQPAPATHTRHGRNGDQR